MNVNCVLFAAINLKKEEIKDKKVIEIGAFNVNGSVRPLVEAYKPLEYIGVDIAKGQGVDVICDVNSLISKFGEQSFDVVISTELMEHVEDWRMAIRNIKGICKKNGIILITTRSYGFPYHGYPYDFWRYEIEDMKYIFQDCLIEKLEKDLAKGVFIKAKKPENFTEKDLQAHELYSIVADRRTKKITDQDSGRFSYKKRLYKQMLKEFFHKQIERVFSLL